MGWDIKSRTGYVRNIKLYRKGRTAYSRRHYFEVTITESASGDDTEGDDIYALPEEIDNVLGHVASDVIHAAMISTLRDALCNGNRVAVTGEKYTIDGYPDAFLREYALSLPHPLLNPLLISVEIVR